MLLRLPLLLLLAILACFPAFAQERGIQIDRIVPRKQVALVIGNGSYNRVTRLKNSVNDAEAMAKRLQDLNFEVMLLRDGSRKNMGQKMDEFIGRLGTGDVAFFYYAGHGVQVEGENYLIPVDFEGDNESDVRYDAHPLGKIQERVERSSAQLNILVLDACRNNPFRFGGRSATNGWAAMSAGRGTFIAFATSPGNIADDNLSSEHGLFTQYLLEALSGQGLGLNEIFDYVRARVDAASKGRQLPWTHSSVVGRYIFRPVAVQAPPATPPPRPAPVQPAIDPVYELRIYTAIAGKLDSLHARMRDAMVPILARHHIESVKYGLLKDRPNTLVHVVKHADAKAREANWNAFRGDPEWQKAVKQSEANGPLVENIDTRLLTSAEFAKIQ